MSEPVRQGPVWAERLRHERSRRGWSRPGMAREMRRAAARLRLGVLDTVRIAEYVKRWEKGRVGVPDIRHQMAIAGAFGMSMSEFFGAAAHAMSIFPQGRAPAATTFLTTIRRRMT